MLNATYSFVCSLCRKMDVCERWDGALSLAIFCKHIYTVGGIMSDILYHVATIFTRFGVYALSLVYYYDYEVKCAFCLYPLRVWDNFKYTCAFSETSSNSIPLFCARWFSLNKSNYIKTANTNVLFPQNFSSAVFSRFTFYCWFFQPDD